MAEMENRGRREIDENRGLLSLPNLDAARTASALRVQRRAGVEAAVQTTAALPKITFVNRCGTRALQVTGAPTSLVRDRLEAREAVPELSYAISDTGKVTTTMTGAACRELVEHCQESTRHGREVGGLLVGYASTRQEGRGGVGGERYDVVVTNAVPIAAFDSSSVHLSFTEEEWERAQGEIRRRHAPNAKATVGWYHTHPEQGIFFSSKDRSAHRIFASPHQFALVVDPRSMEAGLFYWASVASRTVSGPICFPLERRRR